MSLEQAFILRTDGWYTDRPLTLDFPAHWEVTTFWPRTPAPMSDQQIAEALEHPFEQRPIRDLCRGKRRPLVIVDDLVRPTPAARFMPCVLRHFEDAGITTKDVTVIIATGTHAGPQRPALIRKVGEEAFARCRVVVHDHCGPVISLGRTSFRTPVFVDREAARCDFVIGIGGVYPNYSAGFGGGSKLALGILGTRSILHLHYKHDSPGWGASGARIDFRQDLNEIAEMVGLRTVVTVHADANREPVGIVCGDPRLHYLDALAASQRYYGAPLPGDADVVIANPYPTDTTLQFAHMKGATPLFRAAPLASRILLASCREGVGGHGLFPLVNPTSQIRNRLRRISVMSFGEFARNAASKLGRSLRPEPQRVPSTVFTKPEHPIWLYQTEPTSPDLPPVAGVRFTRSWHEVLENVAREQGGKRHLKVVIYPCAAMQFLDPALEAEKFSQALSDAKRR
jgi:nickel-dependent lactate racemase